MNKRCEHNTFRRLFQPFGETPKNNGVSGAFLLAKFVGTVMGGVVGVILAIIVFFLVFRAAE